MTMRKTILGSLIVLISLISCESQKEEDFRISLNYEHPRQQEYPEANFRTTKPVLPYKHHINVKDFIQKNLYDETTLDSDLKGTVEVPVDVELEVEYKNYSIEAPEVWYESGLSDPFIVGFHSPATRTVTIPVSVNPNHPSQVVEEETIDNETVTTETYILSWSDNFTYRQIATIIQENTYKEFWDNASNYTWDNISIGNPDDMVTCDNSTLVNNAIQNFDNTSYEFRGIYCNGMYWTMGKCGWGNEISAHSGSVRDCACKKSTDNSYTIRPLIGNRNWGGVGKSCDAPSQTLKVILQR